MSSSVAKRPAPGRWRPLPLAAGKPLGPPASPRGFQAKQGDHFWPDRTGNPARTPPLRLNSRFSRTDKWGKMRFLKDVAEGAPGLYEVPAGAVLPDFTPTRTAAGGPIEFGYGPQATGLAAARRGRKAPVTPGPEARRRIRGEVAPTTAKRASIAWLTVDLRKPPIQTRERHQNDEAEGHHAAGQPVGLDVSERASDGRSPAPTHLACSGNIAADHQDDAEFPPCGARMARSGVPAGPWEGHGPEGVPGPNRGLPRPPGAAGRWPWKAFWTAGRQTAGE